MGMASFALIFPELAERETRAVQLFVSLPLDDPNYLPPGEYGFLELYSDERKCDCRRVMLNVLARDGGVHLATINHAFEPPGKDELVQEQTFLDPLNKQSRWSQALLDLFINVVLADEAYRRRLRQHYRIFKNAVNDVTHPCQQVLRAGAWGKTAGDPAARRPLIPGEPIRRKRSQR